MIKKLIRALVMFLVLAGIVVFWRISKKNIKQVVLPDVKEVSTSVESKKTVTSEEDANSLETTLLSSEEMLDEETSSDVSEEPSIIKKQRTTKPVPKNIADPVKIKVYLYEWGIDFSRKIASNTNIAFEVFNNGRFSHEFSIEGVRNFGKILPGEKKTFQIKMKQGTYKVSSPKDTKIGRTVQDSFTVK